MRKQWKNTIDVNFIGMTFSWRKRLSMAFFWTSHFRPIEARIEKLLRQVIQSHFLSPIVSNPILLSCLIHCCIVRLDMINWKTNSFCSKSNFVFFDWYSHWHRRLRCYPTKKMLLTPFFLKLKIGFQQKLNVQSKSYRWIDYLWKIKTKLN